MQIDVFRHVVGILTYMGESNDIGANTINWCAQVRTPI